MKIILEASALQPPLTGIGRYTLELAKKLPEQPGVEEVLLLFGGRLIKNIPFQVNSTVALQSPADTECGNVSTKLPFYTRLRWLYFNRYTERALRWLVAQRVALQVAIQLRQGRRYLLHSPNFSAPWFGTRTVVTIHDMSIFKFPECHPRERVKYLRREIPKSVSRAGFIITDSEFTRREVIEYFGCKASKVEAIALGVDKVFRPRISSDIGSVLERYGLSYKGYCLTVSTIEPRKNIERLVSCYLQLPECAWKKWPLVIVGGQGWGGEQIMALIRRAEQLSAVRYLDYVDENDLPMLYAGAHAFLFPSLYEGFGLPVAEAMATGIPVMCSDAASLPEVSDGAALLIDPHDSASIMSGLDTVLYDGAWREAAVDRGLEVAKKYCWDEVASKVADVYRRVELSGGKG